MDRMTDTSYHNLINSPYDSFYANRNQRNGLAAQAKREAEKTKKAHANDGDLLQIAE